MNRNPSRSVPMAHTSIPVSGLDGTSARGKDHLRFWALIVVGFYLALLISAQGQEPNLVKNPSFEAGPVDWIFVENAGWHVRDFQDPAHTGDAEAYVNVASGSVSQVIPTTPDNLYLISFWIAANGFSSFATLSASFGGVTGFTQNYGPGAFGYQEHSFVVKATETTSTFVFAGVMSGGTFFIDDVSVTLISPFPTITTETLSDGSVGKLFEQQLQSSGGLPPFTWTTVAGIPPDGITLASSGLLSGILNTIGVHFFTVRVTASDGMQSETSLQLTVRPPPVCVPLPSRGIAWWGFDEQTGLLAADRIGSNSGGHVNSPVIVGGMVGNGLRFNGNNYVDVPHSDLWTFGTNDFTIELWANFDTAGTGTQGEPGDILIGCDEGPGNRSKWFFALGGGVLEFVVGNPAGGGGFINLGAFRPAPQRWYHLAVIRRGHTFLCYIDSELNGSAVADISIPNVNAPLTIGQAEQIGFMNGIIDEVTIYNRALVAEDLQALVDAERSGKCIDISIDPNVGGNTGRISARINGVGFKPGALAKLTRDGQGEIIGTSTEVGEDGTTITTSFDLRARVTGLWDLTILNPGSEDIHSLGAFTIAEGTPAQPWLQVVGLNLIRTGRPGTYWLYYGNDGNENIPASSLFISVPKQIEYAIDLQGVDGRVPPPLTMSDADSDILTVHLSNISPNNNPPIRFVINDTTGSQSGFDFAATIRSIPSSDREAIASSLLQGLATETSTPGNVERVIFRFPGNTKNDAGHVGFLTGHGTVIDLSCTICDGSDDEIGERPYNPTEWNHGFSIPSLDETQSQALYNWAIAQQGSITYDHSNPKDFANRKGACDGFVEAGLEAIGYRNGDGLISPLGETVAGTLTPGLLYNRLDVLTQNHAPAFPAARVWANVLRGMREDSIASLSSWFRKVLTIVFSWDPNDLIGPEGYGPNRWIPGLRQTPFTILFENLPSAPGAAQEVVVTKQINLELFNINTVSLGPIAFGNRLVTPAAGVSSLTTDVDLRPETNLIVRIVVTLNRNTGLLTWRFTSLDPATRDFPTDPTAGFLPPNRISPEGSGSVSFTIMPREDLPTGTQTRNHAKIIFDFNQPILTPEWLNTIDKTAPSSQVGSLTAEQASPSFLVQWSGSDDGAGVRSFTIYVSEDGQPFTIWLENTSEMAATFQGASGRNYRFYSVARDQVGNEEAAPGEVDAVTKVMVQDTHPPIIIVSGCQTTVKLNSTFAVNVSVDDAHSGVAGQSVPNGNHLLDTSTVGPKTFTVVAQDNTGNSSTNTCSYDVIYDFPGGGGFRSPINNPPVLNTAKAGSGIPVKWQLPNGLGGFIDDLSVVSSIQHQQVACEDISFAISDPVETTTSGNPGLRLDPTTNEYIYVWKTEKNQAGKCYVLILNLNDGHQYMASFSLK